MTAKLDGVSVLDAKGGEVTKLTYKGEVFAKVGASYSSEDLSLINRLSALEYRVTALEGGVTEDNVEPTFVEITRKPQIGDYIKFTWVDDFSVDYVVIGKYYEIIRFETGDAVFVDEDGDQISIDEGRFAFYEKVGGKQAESVIEGAPQVGDKIRIVDAMTLGNYKNGDVLTVRTVGGGVHPDGVRVEEHKTFLYRKEFEIIARPAKIGRKEGEYKKGDIVRITDSKSSVNPIGSIGEITEEVDGYTFRVTVEGISGSNNWHSGDTVELLAPVEARVDLP